MNPLSIFQSLLELSTTRKFFVLFITLTVLAVGVFATNAVIKNIKTKQNEALAIPPPQDGESSPIANIIPPSPNAYELGKYGQIPVGMFTGTANINVPIYTYTSKELSVPISLSYNSNGIKVDQMSTWTGLGWALNAGGVITRIVRDLPDETSEYLFPKDGEHDYTDVTDPLTLDFLYEGSQSTVDTEPDLYMFNFMGQSGKFVFNSQQEIVVMPYQPIKINKTMTNGVTSFEVVTPDGIVYYFGGDGATEQTRSLSSNQATGSSCGKNPQALFFQPSAWYITKIQHPNGDIIEFEYEAETYIYEIGVTQDIRLSTSIFSGGGCPGSTCGNTSPIYNTCTNLQRINGVRLKKITSNHSSLEVVFTPKSSAIGDYGGLLLDNILVSDGNNSGNSVEEFSFNYYNSSTNNRIFLEEITYKDPSKKYQFEYIDKDDLPSRLSYKQDHWGYFNNISNGTYFVPTVNSLYFSGHGKDKSPNGNYAKKGLLRKVTYPTGGYNELYYEPNDYYTTHTVNPTSSSFYVNAVHNQVGGIQNAETPFTAYGEGEVIINVGVSEIIGDDCEEGMVGVGTGVVSLENVTDGSYIMLSVVGASVFASGSISHSLGGSHPNTLTLKGNLSNGTNGKNYKLKVVANRCSEVDATINGVFASQPQTVSENVETGGLRIQKIETHDPVNNKTEEIAYYYGGMNNYNNSSGNPGSLPFYISTSYNRIQCQGIMCDYIDCEYKTLGSSSLTSLFNTGSSNIYYRKVTVSHGGDNFENGGEEHTFVINRDVPADWIYGLNPISSATYTNVGWNHGLEIESKVFKKQNSNFIVLQENENSYVVDSSQYQEVEGFVFRKRYEHVCTPLDITHNCTSDDVNNSFAIWYCTANHNHNWYLGPGHKKQTYDGVEYKTSTLCMAFGANTEILRVAKHKCYGETLPHTVTYPELIENLDIMRYKNISHWFYMNESKSTLYDENGQNPIETTTYYEYDNPEHAQPTMVKTVNSDGTEHISRTKYAADFNNVDANQWQTYTDEKTKGLAKLLYDYKITTPIETRQFIKKQGQSEKMIGGAIAIFDNFSDINSLQPDGNTLPTKAYRFETSSGVTSPIVCSVDANGDFVKDSRYRLVGGIKDYDNKGNLLTYQKEKDIPTSIIWGHNQTLPMAKVINATADEIGYTSFEVEDLATIENGNIQTLSNINSPWVNDAVTGNFAFELKKGNGNNQRIKFDVTTTNKYIVSFWYKDGQVKVQHNDGSTTSNISTTPNKTSWTYKEVKIDATNGDFFVLQSQNNKDVLIDEVRIYPADALMSTYTYNPITRQLVNISDENNLTARFEYDNFNRLSQVFDHDGNLVSYNEYNYQDPNSSGNDGYNWVKNTAILTAGKTVADIPNLFINEKQQNVQYFDGLGRPIQTVAVKQSARQNDIVQHMEYDAFGRADKAFLPFTVTSTNGNFHLNALTQQELFYSDKFVGTSVGNSTAFSQTIFDGSPLNRPIEQGATGWDWRTNGGHTTTMEYLTNTSADAVRDYSRDTEYAANELIKQKVIDENDVPTWSFTDKLGRTILTRRQHTKDNGTIEYAETYTVYDDFGNVETVIPPLAAKILKNTNSYNLDNVEELIYKYYYDYRQRLIEKKIPSAEPHLYVYDALDRIVLTQDGNLRLDHKWQFTKYDILNRPIVSGIYDWDNTIGVEPVPDADADGVGDILIDDGDDGADDGTDDGPTGGISNSNQNSDGLFNHSLYETRNQSIDGYTNIAFPTTNTDLLSVTYYDNYNYDGDNSTTDVSFRTGGGNNTDKSFRRLKGKLTGTKVKVLDNTNTWLYTTTFYDDRGRVIQTRGDNHKGGEDVSSTFYDFAGKVTNSLRWHNVSGQTEIWTKSRYTYDHAGRVLQNVHQIKGQAEIVLSESTYDEVNQMIEKKLHSTNVSGSGYASFLQNVDYKYNIRGWLTDINSVNFGQLTSNELAGEFAKGLVNQIENQNIEIRLDVNELNSGIYSEVEIEDESEYTEGSNTDTETVEENRDVAYDEVLATTLTDAIDLSRMGDIVDETNIEQALEDIKSDLETELTTLGVTNTIAQELVVREVENFYLTTWGATLANDNDNDLYAQHFDYNSSAANAQYNGNISASTWRVRGKDKQHYDYNYDDMNRLRSAHYKAIDDSGNEYNIAGYNMAATYDLNGNILTMDRRGATTQDSDGFATDFDKIDNMTYEYANNSNTLANVYETMSGGGPQLSYVEIKGFKSSLQSGQVAYTYDNNGNLVTDANKDITSIIYNHLNLPQEIEFTNNRKIVFKYDAAGVKLSKMTYDNSTTPTNTHDYIGGIEYENNILQAIYTDEGRAKPNGSAYRYEYTIKDHLGNSRVMFSDINSDGQVDENEVIQEEHYYPFGMRHEGYGRTVAAQGENFYQYNGKELNEDFGLDMYDYGARFYDASVGRWFAVDPLAEKYVGFSPYNYVVNNPVLLIDPDGMRVDVMGSKTFRKQILRSMVKIALSSDEGLKLIQDIISSDRTLVILDAKKEYSIGVNDMGGDYAMLPFDIQKAEADFAEKDGNNGKKIKSTVETTLAHEFTHFLSPLKATDYLIDKNGYRSIHADEVNAVETENIIRKAMGLTERTHYDGVYIYGKKVVKKEYTDKNGIARYGYKLANKENYAQTTGKPDKKNVKEYFVKRIAHKHVPMGKDLYMQHGKKASSIIKPNSGTKKHVITD